MDSFFGIGSMELVVILIIAGIVMGPERIAQAAKWLGKTTAYFQSVSRGFALQLRNELDTIDEKGDLREALKEMQNMQKEVQSLRREVRGMGKELQGVGSEAEAAVQNSIAPPRPLVEEPTPPPHTNGNGLPRLPQPLDVEDD
ncbi:MAG: twin-arginine translocase TatA/TatE family subunit [Chloroflexi bacterium]|nr:twin-arginine translocase TatA/TatE family subunit [Chloroflexota bacterium]